MKKAIVIYSSEYGNTQKISKALAKGIGKQVISVECLEINQINLNELADYDFLAVGGPTHNLGLSKDMKKFLEELKTVDLTGKNGFCFDTRVESRFNKFDLNSAAKRIEKKLRKLKVVMSKPRQSAIVTEREGPLEEGAAKRFLQTGIEIAEFIQGLRY